MSCDEESLKDWHDDGVMPTHVAPSWTKHPRTGDLYSGINKPVAVQDWMTKKKPQEDYILILDADMIMLKPFDPIKMGVAPGWAVSAFYGYLQGVGNDLALKHVPHVLPRIDTLAGPLGRRGDQVGGFTIMRTEDLKVVLPLWIKYTEDVRADRDAWNTSGDAYTKHPGEKPWIAEMYGYSFGAAAANVWHKTDYTAMLYPSYMPYTVADVPNVLHYGLLFEIKEAGYSFDKHWFQKFDALQCPPWEDFVQDLPNSVKGLFPFPPHPSTLTAKGEALLRDLLSVEVIATLNEALCVNYRNICPPSTKLDERCGKATELFQAVVKARQDLKDAATAAGCQDSEARCKEWARKGECGLNPNFMLRACKAACGLCGPAAPKAKRGSVEEASGSERVKSAPETERQASRSTQQADVDAENAELQTPKLLSKAGRAPGDHPPGVAVRNSSVHGGSGVKSPGIRSVAADEGRGAAGGLTGSEDGAGLGLRQVEVDAESAALQLPEMAKAAQQVRVDEESAALQRPETAEVVRQADRDAESAQLQTQGAGNNAAAKLPPVRHTGGTGQMPKRGLGKEKSPLKGYSKFLADMAVVREEQRRQRMERLCTGNPTYSLSEVRDCLAAAAEGREWEPPKPPAARSQLLQVDKGALQQGAEGDEIDGQAPPSQQSLGSWFITAPRGQAVLLLIVFALIALPRLRQRKQSPLLKVYRHD
ncbi:g4007 [Coccomyxa elongata]